MAVRQAHETCPCSRSGVTAYGLRCSCLLHRHYIATTVNLSYPHEHHALPLSSLQLCQKPVNVRVCDHLCITIKQVGQTRISSWNRIDWSLPGNNDIDDLQDPRYLHP